MLRLQRVYWQSWSNYTVCIRKLPVRNQNDMMVRVDLFEAIKVTTRTSSWNRGYLKDVYLVGGFKDLDRRIMMCN